jgi:hypothetical protein
MGGVLKIFLKNIFSFLNIKNNTNYIIYIFEKISFVHSFETRFGGSTRDLADLELEPSRVEEKIEEGKTQCDSVDMARPGQNPKPPGFWTESGMKTMVLYENLFILFLVSQNNFFLCPQFYKMKKV